MIDVKIAVFFLLMLKCYNTLTSTLANEYPSSNETSKKNGTVRGVLYRLRCLVRILLSLFLHGTVAGVQV